MSEEASDGGRELPLDLARNVDRICDAFEAQWIGGGRPAIEDHLRDSDQRTRPALVRELILIDSHYRRKQGESPLADLYVVRFPEVEAAWLRASVESETDTRSALREQLGFPSIAGIRSNVSRAAIGPPPLGLRNFDDYELMEELGRGGMGVVYKARQVSLNRIVAIKMILSGLQSSPADVERFHAEAEAAANLNHPGIVPIIEVGECQGQHYFSMGYVEGRSLADRLAEGPVPPREAAQFVVAVCDAVQFAHDRGVIHRDLKPGNILLGHDGRPRITDFGLAKCLSDDSGRTRSGQVLGTPSYIPPEQAAGKLDLIGPAADIYALGAILYALLTGRPPFHAASSLDTLRQVLENEPLRPTDLAPGTPRDLETIALKCLQKPIAQRYGSAGELADDLQLFLEGRPIRARPVSRWERGWRWCRRNPYLAMLSGAVALLVTLVAVISTTAAFKYREQLSRAETATQAENLAKQDTLAKLWDSYLVAARAGRASKQPGQRFASLRAIESALALATPQDRSKDELRTEAIAAMLLPDLEESKQLPGYLKGTLGVAIDSTFQRYARAGADGRVSIRQVADDLEICQLPGIGSLAGYEGLVFSPGGSYLMQCCQTPQGPLRRIWNLQGLPRLVLSCGAAYDFSPDGSQLATVATDASIRLYDLKSGKEQQRYRLAGFAPDWLLWNPRREILFARAADHQSYRLLDLATGTFGPSISAPYGISWLRWHPEGRLLAIADSTPQRTKIQLVRADTGARAMPPLEAHRTGGVMLRFNHYGDRLLSTDWTGLWRLWDVQTGQILLTQPADGNELRFSEDDKTAGLDCSPRGIRLFRFESGRELYKIVHRVNSTAVPYSDPDHGFCQLDPEGRLLAYRVPEGIAVVDVIRGEEAALLSMDAVYPVRTDDSGALVTHGRAGLMRWPMIRDPKTSRRVYGPPQKLAPAMGRVLNGAASDKSCRVLAFADFNEGAVEMLLPEGRPATQEDMRRLGPQEDVRHCAVSPDGRWIATGSHGAVSGPAAGIWAAQTGRHVCDLPVTAQCCLAFSPDGRWLLTTGGGARLWSVGDWHEGPNLGPSAKRGVFSCGGDLLALQDVPGVVRLVLPGTAKEVARLTAPEGHRLTPLCFTRNGSRLVCWVAEEETLCVFNLGLIRSKLAAMGLDWEGPPCPAEGDRLPEPIAVKVMGME
jgi:eukaryotic-like serine/threonine-protein kinase